MLNLMNSARPTITRTSERDSDIAAIDDAPSRRQRRAERRFYARVQQRPQNVRDELLEMHALLR